MLDAISEYHDLLSNDQLAADSQAMLDDQLARHGLVFGGRALCTVLRPRLTNLERHAWLHQRVRLLMRVFAKSYAAAIASAEFRRQFIDRKSTRLNSSHLGISYAVFCLKKKKKKKSNKP